MRSTRRNKTISNVSISAPRKSKSILQQAGLNLSFRLVSDNESLQTQNEELRVLLHQYVTMEVNKDLQGKVRSTFNAEINSRGSIILNNSDSVKFYSFELVLVPPNRVLNIQ